MSEGIGYKILVRVAPFLVHAILRVWFLTCRLTLHGEEFFRAAQKSDKPYIATFWHYSIAYIFYNLRNEKGAAMVSASKDGEYIARVAGHFGLETVRGSSNKQGLRALKQLIGLVKKGKNAGIVADGSQGPALKVQAGSILLASKCGCPILPMVWSANKYIAFGSWDRMSLPKPFSKVEFFYGEPFNVPPKVSSEELEEYRVKLEIIMNELYLDAWKVQGKETH